MNDIEKIRSAWEDEGSICRLGMRPAADKTIQGALVPPGGDWSCVALDGAVTRSIIWNGTEVALVNPRGDMVDHIEGHMLIRLTHTGASC